ncbi:DNA-binding response regulator [Acinetobacter wanghuae]|uniref:DNA-binding response regulator n=1 Tax=Acinetobacter wanghuae TaxID=2662362 RepID=UPI003AF4BE08
MTLAMMLPVPILIIRPSADLDLSKIDAVIQALGYHQDMVLYADHEQDAATIIEQHLPNLILYGVASPAHVEFISRIKQKLYNDQFITVVAFSSAPLIYSALLQGIDSYLLLEQPIEDLSESLKIALRGGAYLHSDVAQYLLDHIHQNSVLMNKINLQEQQLLSLFAQNMPFEQILQHLQLHDFQVHQMVRQIYRKIAQS